MDSVAARAGSARTAVAIACSEARSDGSADRIRTRTVRDDW